MASLPARVMQVAIIDDEPLARCKIRDLLESDDEFVVVGEASGASSAIALIDEAKPDLVFLDIQMPDGTGIEVLKAVRHEPGVIFTTAFDAFAITAFDVGAVDYLLKPFSRERFRQALRRAQEAMRGDDSIRAFHQLPNGPADGCGLQQLFVRTRSGNLNIEVADIEYFQGQGDYVQLSANGRSHLIPANLKELETKLEGPAFLRIHRSYIVNLKFVDLICPVGNGRYCVVMKDGTELRASRPGAALLRERMRQF